MKTEMEIVIITLLFARHLFLLLISLPIPKPPKIIHRLGIHHRLTHLPLHLPLPKNKKSSPSPPCPSSSHSPSSKFPEPEPHTSEHVSWTKPSSIAL